MKQIRNIGKNMWLIAVFALMFCMQAQAVVCSGNQAGDCAKGKTCQSDTRVLNNTKHTTYFCNANCGDVISKESGACPVGQKCQGYGGAFNRTGYKCVVSVCSGQTSGTCTLGQSCVNKGTGKNPTYSCE